MIFFGAGNVWVKESSGTTPKTIKIATLKAASLDITEEVVKAYGQNKYPIDVANGQASLTGSLTLGEFEPGLFQAVLAGATSAAGYEQMVTDASTAIPTTPFTITVTGATGYKEDFGVKFTGGDALTRVASAPTAGQYSVNETTGIYTFASADNVSAKSVEISYSQTIAATGQTISYANQLMGSGTTWKLRLWNTYGSHKIGYYLPAVKLLKHPLQFESQSHMAPEISFEAFQDSTGSVFKLFAV